MRIIFGTFDNLAIKLLSYKNLFDHICYRFLQNALKFKNAKKIFKKIQMRLSTHIFCFEQIVHCIEAGELRAGGVKVADIFNAGYDVNEMIKGGCSVSLMKEKGALNFSFICIFFA